MEVTAGSSESSTVEQLTYEQHDHVQSEDLQLGLGLSLGGLMGTSTKNHHRNDNNNNNNNNNNKSSSMQIPRFLTAKDLPCSSTSSCSSLGLRTPTAKTNTNVCVGTKRAVSPTALSQVVGWPPIRQFRMSSMANQAKSIANGERNSQFDESQGKDKGYANSKDKVPCKSPLFVKVNMDGVVIGRKVDLTAHSDYESLARALEQMFTNKAEKSNAEELTLMPKVTRPSKLLDGTSDFVLTYEDKDGDWMLVGDVPWGMFVTSVKRLKIMRTSEANGLDKSILSKIHNSISMNSCSLRK